MVEIAKAVARHSASSRAFDIQFISDGGEFESLIEKNSFPLTRLEPRLTKEKIEHIARVDRGEKFTAAFTDREMIRRVESEIACLKKLKPAAVVTGSYLTIPITCRVLKTPLVWVVQSTWLPDFFRHGAGMTDKVRPASVKTVADLAVMKFINFWIKIGFLNSVNRTAKHFGVPGYDSIFEFWRGDITLVAEPPEFSRVNLPPNHYFTGPLIPQDEFKIPPELASIPRDKPLIYFAMGSSGTPEIVARIIESFEGKPYRVIAPVKFELDKVPGVRVPSNVLVTDWVPALEVNKMADFAVIHGGIGTVMTAALAGKPVVGVGMQMEQVANLACLERLGFAIRIPKSKDPSRRIQAAIQTLMHDESAKAKATAFAKIIAPWDGPKLAAEKLLEHYGSKLPSDPDRPGGASGSGFQTFAENISIVDGPSVRAVGITFPTRMILVKLADGSLWVNSPVSVSSEMLGHIRASGPVRYLVAPTKMHVWRLEEWHKLFPEAELWLPPQIPRKFKRLPLAGILDDTPPRGWADDFDQLVFKGNFFIEEVYFFHKKSRTVIFGDFIQNHQMVKGRPILSALFKVLGVSYPHGGVGHDIRLTFTNRNLARRSLEKLLSWDFDKLVIAHGICVEKDAKPFVEQAFRWLWR